MESQNDNGLNIDLEYSMILNDMSMQWYFDAMGFYSSKQESGWPDWWWNGRHQSHARKRYDEEGTAGTAGTVGTTTQALSEHGVSTITM